MPAYIAPIENTRSFSVKPARGLRYGNFEGVVHLPPVSYTTKLGEHSFSTLNNQQIYKTVCEWFEGWRLWQQRVLLCGIVDRCSRRQVDILATTLEPIKHRDYTVAVKHHYPSTPLKKTRDDPSKKKRKKKKLRKKKVEKEEKREIDAEAEDISLISEQTFDDFISLEGAETPESVIVAIPNFVTREGEKLLEDKLNRLKQQRRKKEREFREQYEKSLAKTKADKPGGKHDTNEGESYYAEDQNEGIVDNFAGALAEKIVDDTLSLANVEPEVDLTSSYAQALASAIVTRAVNNAVGILTEKFEKEKLKHMENESKIVKEKSLVKESGIVKGKPSAKVLDNFREKSSVDESSVVKADIVKRKPSMKRSATIHEIKKNVSTETDNNEMVSKNMDNYNASLQRSGRKTTSPVRFSEKQVDFTSHCISTSLKKYVSMTRNATITVCRPIHDAMRKRHRAQTATAQKLSSSASTKSHGLGKEDILTEDQNGPNKADRPRSVVRIVSPEEQATENRDESKRVQSAHSGVSQSLSVVTRSSINKMRYDLFGSNVAVSTPDFFGRRRGVKFGVQRELRVGNVNRPMRLQNIPVPVTRMYKSVKWWPEDPGEGKIFFKAHQEELNTNFRDQLQQVWNWMALWEDYEKIALLKELLKLSGPENLGFLASHIQQQLRDARDVNRLSDKLLLYIFSFMAADEIKVMSRVCRRWRFLCVTDDLWMIKCHELGLVEGIKNLETMIVRSKTSKMGIDWRLAYEELRRITQMMKLGFAKGKKKKGKEKVVDFKAEMEKLRQTGEAGYQYISTPVEKDSNHVFSEDFSDENDASHARFGFSNQVTANAGAPDNSLSRDQLQNILKRILFEPEEMERAASRGTPQIVELEVHRGTVSAVRRQEQDDDNASVVSEDLREFDEEYRLKKTELPERRRVRLQRSLTRYTPGPGDMVSRSETRFDRLQRINMGPVPLRPSLRHKQMKDDADVEDAAYDIRPDLAPAQDILGKTAPHMKLEWQSEKPKDEEVDDNAPYDDSREPSFVGLVRSVLRARKLQGHMNGILCVQFDHRRLVSAGLDRVIRLWDIRSGRSLHKFYGHKGGIRCMQFIDNDLVTGSWDTTIMVWDLRNLCRKYILNDHHDSISCLQFNQDFLVSGSHDTTVRVYRRISYLCCQVIRGHTGPVTGLAFDGSHVVSASMDTTLRLSNIITGQCIRVFEGNKEPILTITMKGSLIITGDPQGQVQFWNKQTGECEAAIKAHSEAVHKLGFLDGRFYTASGDGTIKEWDLVTMTSVRVLQGHKGPVRDIKVSSNRIVSCSDDGSIRIWDLFDPRKKISVDMQIRQLHHE